MLVAKIILVKAYMYSSELHVHTGLLYFGALGISLQIRCYIHCIIKVIIQWPDELKQIGHPKISH